MNAVELRAARRAGLLDKGYESVFCEHVDRIIFYLKELERDISGWKWWVKVGFKAAIAALTALKLNQCGENSLNTE